MDNSALARRVVAEMNPFAKLLGIEIGEVRPGFAVASLALDIPGRHGNPFGTANAGAIFALAEAAFGAAALAHGFVAVAASFAINYIRPGLSGTLTAEARESAPGPRLASFEVVVRDEAGEPIATAQGMAWYRKEPLTDLLPG